MDLPPLDTDLYDRLREDIRLRGIQVPLLVDNATGDVIDGKLRKQIAVELKIRDIPTIYVARLSPEERDDLRLAVNLYRRHLSRPQMREMIAWALKQRPEASDRSLADGCGVDHKTVGGIRKRLESTGEFPSWTPGAAPTPSGEEGVRSRIAPHDHLPLARFG
jgi:ParB-like chromosome segregation protein Spo0J